MKKLALTIAAVATVGFAGSALAQPPGQDKTCLFAFDTTIPALVNTKFLPRKAADNQIAKGVGHAKDGNVNFTINVTRAVCDALDPS